MTLLEIRNTIRVNLLETVAKFWVDAEINNWINSAHRVIVNSLNDSALFSLQKIGSAAISAGTTLADAFYIALPADFSRAYAVFDSDKKFYRYYPLNLFLKHDDVLPLSKAYIYSVWDKKLLLSAPAALTDKTAYCGYIKIPLALSLDGDVSDLSDDLLALVIYYSTAQALVKEGNPEAKNYLEQFWGEIKIINSRYVSQETK